MHFLDVFSTYFSPQITSSFICLLYGVYISISFSLRLIGINGMLIRCIGFIITILFSVVIEFIYQTILLSLQIYNSNHLPRHVEFIVETLHLIFSLLGMIVILYSLVYKFPLSIAKGIFVKNN
jgi:hypothetical protein